MPDTKTTGVTVTQTITYYGRALPVFTSKTPVVFDNGGKVMLVDARKDKISCFPRPEKVLAYIPGRDFPVITADGEYRCCAEEPDQYNPVNEYVPGNWCRARKRVEIIFSYPAEGRLEQLSRIAVNAAKSGSRVLFIGIEFDAEALLKKCAISLCGVAEPEQYEYEMLTKKTGNNIRFVSIKQDITSSKIVDAITSSKIGDATHGADNPDLVIIDGISLVHPVGTNEPRLIALARELNDIAHEHNVTIITTAFLSR